MDVADADGGGGSDTTPGPLAGVVVAAVPAARESASPPPQLSLSAVAASAVGDPAPVILSDEACRDDEDDKVGCKDEDIVKRGAKHSLTLVASY